MNKKKTILALIALVAVLAVMVGIWYSSRPKPEPKGDDVQTTTQQPGVATQQPGDTTPTGYSKYFTVEVVHSDGTVKTFEYGTNEDYLGDVLVAEGLIVESDSPGLYNTVDGEDAIWSVNQSYWSFIINGEIAMEGINTTLIEHGAVYRLEYTLG